jgi:DNA-binding phage protein
LKVSQRTAIRWTETSGLPPRHRDWNEGLSQDLRDRTFAREFLLAAADDGASIQLALATAIRAIGVRKFAASVHMAPPTVLRAISRRHNPAQKTLNRLLRPFRLRLSLAPIERCRPRRRTTSSMKAGVVAF